MNSRVYPAAVIAVVLFFSFFVYYNWLSEQLPYNAGPDEYTHYEAANFYYENKRLAKYPDDVDKLHFTPYGTTRVYRAPFYYATAGWFAQFWSPEMADARFATRKASVLLGTATVTITFITIFIYTGFIGIGVLSAVILGFMPQFAFISSYTNSDAAAIFASSIVILALVLLFKLGERMALKIFFGLALAIAFLSKPTAWVMFPVILVFSILLFYKSPVQIAKSMLVVLVVFGVGIGWWFAFNIFHHGLENFMNGPLQDTLMEKFKHSLPSTVGGFSTQGISFWQLLTNDNGFLTASFFSTVGLLDWVSLRLGDVQYIYYGLILVIGLSLFLLRPVQLLLTAEKYRTTPKRQLLFETMLLIVLLFQLLMYVWVNYAVDVQMQGKYLLPGILALLILFSSTWVTVWQMVAEYVSPRIGRILSNSLLALGLAATGSLHAHAFVKYVRPYYDSGFYTLAVSKFTRIDNFVPARSERHNAIVQQLSSGDYKITSSGEDPWVALNKSLVANWNSNKLMRISLSSPMPGWFSIYWDEGNGMNQANSVPAFYGKGKSTLYLPIKTDRAKKLRLDPSVGNSEITIHALSLADMSWQLPRGFDLGIGSFVDQKSKRINLALSPGDQWLDTGSTFRLESSEGQPWLGIDSDIGRRRASKWWLRVRIAASSPGQLAVKWNEGLDQSSEKSQYISYAAGERELLFFIQGRYFENVRLYPEFEAGALDIKSVSLAPLVVTQEYPNNTIFK